MFCPHMVGGIPFPQDGFVYPPVKPSLTHTQVEIVTSKLWSRTVLKEAPFQRLLFAMAPRFEKRAQRDLASL